MQVNSLNQRIGKISRDQMCTKIYFRTCNMFLFDGNNKLYVQKRAMTVEPFPGYWDACPGGVVRIKETDLEAVLREISEEMGIVPKDVTKIATISIENEGWFWWSTIFKGFCKEEIKKSAEVEDYALMNIQEINDRIQAGEKFTPGCLSGLRLLV